MIETKDKQEKKIAQIRKSNMKLYPIYKMIGLDWIFYYGVKILFLTQVKSISPADIVLSGSFYSFIYMIFGVFSSIIVDKIGKKKSIVIGQLLNFIAMTFILYCPNFAWLLASQAICAIGFSLKSISESSFLNVSVPQSDKKAEIFSKIDSRGYSKFCFVGAVSTLISGFLYAINPYIPIFLCLASNLLAFIIALNFIDIEKLLSSENNKEHNSKQSFKQSIKDCFGSFSFIIHSRRLRTLLIMLACLWGIVSVFATYQETLLKELNIPSYYIGFIISGFQMLVGMFAIKSSDFNKKFKNHSLTYIGLIITIGSIILGIGTLLKIPFEIQLMIVTFVFIARAYAKGMFQVLKKRYMNNFSNSKVLPKIYSVNNILANASSMILGFIASALLKVTSLQNSLLILGIFTTVLVIILAIYSKTRLGLKPEEYSKEDIGNKEECIS